MNTKSVSEIMGFNAASLARLQALTWQQRIGIIGDGIERTLAKMNAAVADIRDPDDKLAHIDGTLVDIHAAIYSALEAVGEAVPVDAYSCGLFALSLSPKHRQIAKAWAARHGSPRMYERNSALARFRHLSDYSQPALSILWRQAQREDR